jgi:hypothetical protein
MVMISVDNRVKQQHKSCAEYHGLSSSSKDNSNVNDDSDTVNRNINFKKQFLELPDIKFNELLRIRFKLPVLKERNEVEVEPKREYWLLSYTIDQLFNEMSETVEIVIVGGKRNHTYKYHDRALKIFELFGITKSNLDFVINFSDLSPRLIAELKVLDKKSADNAIKLAVDKIFESIDSERYRNFDVSKRLKVRFDR